MRAYRGPLLPQSDAPGVVQRRESIERQMRAAVLALAEPDLMVAWTRSRWGADDLEMWQRQAPDSAADLTATAARRCRGTPARSRAAGAEQALTDHGVTSTRLLTAHHVTICFGSVRSERRPIVRFGG
jgi:hypothetical protein